MGLDMYARRVKSESAIDSLSIADGADSSELYYWRKHHDLHGWMANLYNAKGGTAEFNCRQVQLTLEDLDSLESDLKESLLPATEGFFFGQYPPDADSVADDLNFITDARKVINEGDCVYYSAWY